MATGEGSLEALIVHRVTELEEWRREITQAIKEIVSMQHEQQLFQREVGSMHRELASTIASVTNTLDKVDSRVENVESFLPFIVVAKSLMWFTLMGILSLVGLSAWDIIIKERYAVPHWGYEHEQQELREQEHLPPHIDGDVK